MRGGGGEIRGGDKRAILVRGTVQFLRSKSLPTGEHRVGRVGRGQKQVPRRAFGPTRNDKLEWRFTRR
jgi:hypothetical protein